MFGGFDGGYHPVSHGHFLCHYTAPKLCFRPSCAYSAFYSEYHKYHPKAEPFFNERVALYELYHHLNHWYIFGGGYNNSAAQIMRGLVQKFQ